MKKLISIIIAAALVALTALVLAGCDAPAVSVESVMNIGADFSGTRVITVKYPLSADIDSIKDGIIADAPVAGTVGAAFEYKGVEEDGYYFELSFSFADKDEYERQISKVIGRSANSFLSVKNTALTRGARMAENFDLADLVAWMARATAAENATKDLRFDYSGNSVVIGDKAFTTASAININEVEGYTVNSVGIRTSNDKSGSYNRTFVFSVPNETYIAAKDDFERYFLTNTAPASKYYGWTAEGANMQYTVIFEGLSINELSKYTSMLLDTDNIEISYADKDNSSTPLSEGLAFEESLDTFSFIGPDKGYPELSYSYSLPTNTIHGDGALFADGRWTPAGKWEEGVYKLSLDAGSVQLRIPDGIQYSINGIDFSLESLGGERFRRTTSFLYSKTDGYDGMNYAYGFFVSKGAQAEIFEDGDDLVCSVISEGTAGEITAELVKLFGSGNFMAYRKTEGVFALSTKTVLTDYINLGAILNSSNANRPMRYFVSSSGEENIATLSIDGAELAYKGRDKTPLTVTGGRATVEYHGNIPITSHIVIYLLAGGILLAITIVIAYLMLRTKKSRKLSPEAQKVVDSVADGSDDGDGEALAQTTTFSIAELGALSRNKRYVDEINKDVEKRLEADRLEERKRELRAKELEEMERRVYGPEDKAGERQDAAEADDGSDFVQIPDLPDIPAEDGADEGGEEDV